MSLGLTSILDFGSNSNDSQKSLFTEKEWRSLQNYYTEKYKIGALPMPFEAYTAAWNTAIQVVKENL